MGQEEVLKVFMKKKILTLKELSQELNITTPSIWAALNRLTKQGKIEREMIEPEKAEKYGMKKAGSKHIIWKLKEK